MNNGARYANHPLESGTWSLVGSVVGFARLAQRIVSRNEFRFHYVSSGDFPGVDYGLLWCPMKIIKVFGIRIPRVQDCATCGKRIMHGEKIAAMPGKVWHFPGCLPEELRGEM
jgi:hypothetical protein